MLRYQDFMFKPNLRAPVGSTGLLTVVGVAIGIALAGCSADFQRSSAPLLGLNGDPSSEQRTSSVSDDADIEFAQSADVSPSSLESRSSAKPEPSDARPGPIARLDGDAQPVRSAPPPVVRQKPRFAAVPPSPGTLSSIDQDEFTPVATGSLQGRRGGTITVAAGDTLYQLARRHRVSVDGLRRANRLTGNVIRPGQTLILPGSEPVRSNARPLAPERSYRRPPVRTAPQTANQGTYTVQPGDSLYRISRRTGVSVSALQRLNGITDVRALRPGTELSLSGQSDIARSQPIRRPRARAAARSTAPKVIPQRQETTVASRTNFGAQPLIKAKPIRTVPITRPNATPSRQASPAQPRILNQRPNSPIVTRPKPKLAVATSPAPQAQKFSWPAKGRIIAKFNNSGQGVKNEGVNIALPMGTDIQAAEAGVVAYAGSELKGYGNLVLLRHDNGWVSAYAHASKILVKRGDRVKRGQTIAKAGRSGDVSQSQLHFELRKGAKPVDPLPHLASL